MTTTVNDIDDIIDTGGNTDGENTTIVTPENNTLEDGASTTNTEVTQKVETQEDAYVPEYTEVAEDVVTPITKEVQSPIPPVVAPTTTTTISEHNILNSIAEKFGLDGTFTTTQQLQDALFEKKVDATFESNYEVKQLSAVIQSENPEDILRYELSRNKQQYGILSNSDLERRISQYVEDDELESIAENIKANLENRLGQLFEQTKAAEAKKSEDSTKVAAEIFEVQQKIKSTIDNYAGTLKSFIKESDLKGIALDTKQYILSGKYVDDAWGEKNMQDMNSLIENAMWVNPKTRAYLINAIAKEAVKRGESNFIKEHLFGKTISIGSATTAVGGATKYSNEL